MNIVLWPKLNAVCVCMSFDALPTIPMVIPLGPRQIDRIRPCRLLPIFDHTSRNIRRVTIHPLNGCLPSVVGIPGAADVAMGINSNKVAGRLQRRADVRDEG